jgi:hypothetical protein
MNKIEIIVRINLIQLKLFFLKKNKNYYHIHVNNASEIN